MPSSPSSSTMKPASESRPRVPLAHHGTSVWLVIPVIALRLAVGALFIVSGFAKAVDPWGFVIKMGEFLKVWEMTMPHAVLVNCAVGLAALEFVCGMMLLLGCFRRGVVWVLLLMMAGMLPLTFYIYLRDPVPDCGCFGEMWHISNAATFFKNVAITAALVFLAMYNRRVRCAVSPYVQWIPALLSLLYCLMLSLDGYREQPLVDFRSFPQGVSLLPSSVSEGAQDESVDDSGESDEAVAPEFEFLYEKDGERRVFTLDNLPDSTWTFLDRRLITGGIHATDGFTIYDTEGNDVTADVIAPSGPMVIITVPSVARADISFTYYINRLYAALSARDVPMIAVVAGSDRRVELWRDVAMAEYPVYAADPSQIQELARGTTGVVVLMDGVVSAKWNAETFFEDYFNENSADDAGEGFGRLEFLYPPYPDNEEYLQGLTAIYLIAMAAVIAVNNGFLAILALWRSRLRRKRSRSQQPPSGEEGRS